MKNSIALLFGLFLMINPAFAGRYEQEQLESALKSYTKSEIESSYWKTETLRERLLVLMHKAIYESMPEDQIKWNHTYTDSSAVFKVDKATQRKCLASFLKNQPSFLFPWEFQCETSEITASIDDQTYLSGNSAPKFIENVLKLNPDLLFSALVIPLLGEGKREALNKIGAQFQFYKKLTPQDSEMLVAEFSAKDTSYTASITFFECGKNLSVFHNNNEKLQPYKSFSCRLPSQQAIKTYIGILNSEIDDMLKQSDPKKDSEN